MSVSASAYYQRYGRARSPTGVGRAACRHGSVGRTRRPATTACATERSVAWRAAPGERESEVGGSRMDAAVHATASGSRPMVQARAERSAGLAVCRGLAQTGRPPTPREPRKALWSARHARMDELEHFRDGNAASEPGSRPVANWWELAAYYVGRLKASTTRSGSSKRSTPLPPSRA